MLKQEHQSKNIQVKWALTVLHDYISHIYTSKIDAKKKKTTNRCKMPTEKNKTTKEMQDD